MDLCKKILINICLLFSFASFAGLDLNALLYFSKEIVSAKILWDQCPLEKAIGPNKDCDLKAFVKEVHKGEKSLLDRTITIKNFDILPSREIKNEPELFLFIDNRNLSNEVELMATIDNVEYWKYMRSRSRDSWVKDYIPETLKQQSQPEHKRPSLANFYNVRGYLDNYKTADDIFVVEVLNSRSVGWRTIFTWPIFFGLSEYQMEVKFLVKEVLKGDKKLVGKEFAFYFMSIGPPPSYLREGKDEPGEYGCEEYPSYVKGKEFIFPLKREDVFWNSSSTEAFAHWAFLYKYGYCPRGYIYKDNLAFRYRKELVEEAQALER